MLDRQAPDRAFDMFVLDAFSSDAIPTHLLTQEALELYQRKLTDAGVLVFHISNRHLDLASVLADLAPHVGMVGLVARDVNIPLEKQQSEGRAVSTWVAMARDAAHLRGLPQRSRWQELPASAAPPWTDDFSNIVRILRWRAIACC